jgi:RNA 3'-terminal phosphate cyclase-like protein
MDTLTKGTTIEIDETGTSITYKPGVILGGSYLTHDCSLSRGIGYFLEGILCLAPFSKNPISIKLTGITNHSRDISIDTFRNITLFLMKKFGLPTNPTIQILKRGASPNGGGEIQFDCPIVKNLTPIQILDEGMIKRIRGIAYSTRVSPSISNRVVESSRFLLNKYIPDVWVFTDHYLGQKSGLSPGFAIMLQAETDTGCRLSVECTGTSGMVPEDLGSLASKLLCCEIEKGGCVDTANQWLVLLYMALSPEDVSKVRFGKLSDYSIDYMRNIQKFFGVTFKIEEEENSLVLSCVGCGFKNFNKKTF